jgi:hypothetical protein
LFTATNVSVGEDEDCWFLALTDDGDIPVHYILIQRGRSFDEQDRSLGMDDLYYEINDQLNSFHGGVSHIALSRSTLILRLAEAVAQSRRLPTELSIGLALTMSEFEELRGALRRITESFVSLEEVGE